MTTTIISRAAAVLLAAVGSAALLSGCRAVQTVPAAAPASSAPQAAASQADPSATASPPAAPVASGSVTVSITSPITRTGSASTNVACVNARVYRAGAASAVVDGDQIAFTVAIAGYHGLGSYLALVTATLRQASGTVTTVAGVPQVPAVITGTGGSFSLSATGEEGRVLASSVSWTCG